MKVLVTGSSGFLGKALVKRLMREPGVTRVVGLSRSGELNPSELDLADCFYGLDHVRGDVLRGDRTRAVMALLEPDVVFHLAADALVKEGKDPERQYAVNVMGTRNVLAACPDGCRFVLASSAAVYGDNASPGREGQALTPNSTYGASKVAAEALADAHHRLGRVSALSLRFIALAGPGATHGLVRDLVRKLRGGWHELQLFGDAPGSSKPYLHVDDAAEALVRLGFNYAASGPVNVGPEDSVTVEQAAHAAMAALDVYKSISWLGEGANWAGDNRRVMLDCSLAKKLGWSARRDSLGAITQAAKELAFV